MNQQVFRHLTETEQLPDSQEEQSSRIADHRRCLLIAGFPVRYEPVRYHPSELIELPEVNRLLLAYQHEVKYRSTCC